MPASSYQSRVPDHSLPGIDHQRGRFLPAFVAQVWLWIWPMHLINTYPRQERIIMRLLCLWSKVSQCTLCIGDHTTSSYAHISASHKQSSVPRKPYQTLTHVQNVPFTREQSARFVFQATRWAQSARPMSVRFFFFFQGDHTLSRKKKIVRKTHIVQLHCIAEPHNGSRLPILHFWINLVKVVTFMCARGRKTLQMHGFPM